MRLTPKRLSNPAKYFFKSMMRALMYKIKKERGNNNED